MHGSRSFGLIIDGEVVPTAATREIRNPASGEVIGSAPLASLQQLDAAVEAAGKAQAAWRDSSDDDRLRACRDMAAA
ncbi:MAG: aldehyde dehydrogenase family protein, partial [Pseudomonadota bacterium]